MMYEKTQSLEASGNLAKRKRMPVSFHVQQSSRMHQLFFIEAFIQVLEPEIGQLQKRKFTFFVVNNVINQ